MFEIGRLEHLVISPYWMPYSELFWLIVCGGVPLLALYVSTPYPFLSPGYAWRKPSFTPWFWKYFFVMVAHMLMVNVIFFKTGQSVWRFPSLPVIMWIKLVMTVLIEESAFRGVIYYGLFHIKNEGIAMMGSLMLFILLHVPAWYLKGATWTLFGEQLFALGVFTILLTNLTRYSKSLFPAAICHFMYNLSFLL